MRKKDLMIALFLSMAVLFLYQTALASPIFNVRFDFEAGDGPLSVAIGDLNGDDLLDLAVANAGSDTVSALLGNGDGTFQSAVNYEAGDVPLSVALSDVDGDGALDMAVANIGSNNVSVLMGNGDGTFQSAVNYGAGDVPLSVALSDVDGDGALDMAVANVGSNNVSVLMGNGDGTFQSAVDYGAGGEPRSVAIGDLDGDGALDLAVVNSGLPGNVSVLLGNGDGTFQSAVNYGAGYNANSVAIGDLDGDGALDLAVANLGISFGFWTGDTVSVLLGNGDGTFQSAVDYGAGDGPWCSVAIGDLNGDDLLDLAVAHEWSGTVSVLLGNGDGTFRSAVNYGAGDGPCSVAIGDLDGDDVLDLAVANSGSDNVSVFINSLDSVETVYPKGWSMISLPADPTDKRLNKLFPDAVVVYGYKKGTGYVRVKPDENLVAGRGYWILLDQAKSYTLTGSPIQSYTHPASSDGWTMIGGCSSLAQVSSNNCEIGVIYGYAPGEGYQWVTGHLERGKGYWILLRDVTDPASLRVQGSGE